MDLRRFSFPILVLDATGKPVKHAGCAFPINRQGDLVTCAHVVDRQDADGHQLPLGVFDRARKTMHTPTGVVTADWPGLDLAVIPRAFGEETDDFFPVIERDQVLMGLEVYTSGSYTTDGRLDRMRNGYFKGSIVSIEPGSLAVKETPFERLLLPYPIIEGLSGSPILVYHNGVKVVGVCFGSEALRVQAVEVTEVEDGDTKFREETHRIVEYGLGYPAGLLTDWLQDAGHPPSIVTSGSVANPAHPDLAGEFVP